MKFQPFALDSFQTHLENCNEFQLAKHKESPLCCHTARVVI